MEREKRVITKLPLEELWSAAADFPDARRLRYLDREELTQLLREGPVWFVVANVGHRPVWVELDQCFDFWKREVKPHLASPGIRIYLDQYPGEYAYSARRWSTHLTNPVVVLEKMH